MRLLWAMLAAVVALHAEPVTLGTGQSAVFRFGIWNFAQTAGTYPERIDIILDSPPAIEGRLSATLESLDGSAALMLVGASMTQGYVSSANYTGASTVFQAGIFLPPDTAADLFGPASLARWSDGGTIRIRNEGDPFTIGLPETEVTAAVQILLQGNGLSMGAVSGSVNIEPAPGAHMRLVSAAAPDIVTPEPGAAGLTAAALCLIYALFSRRSATR